MLTDLGPVCYSLEHLAQTAKGTQNLRAGESNSLPGSCHSPLEAGSRPGDRKSPFSRFMFSDEGGWVQLKQGS